MPVSPTVIDLFSGCGGMSTGLEMAGFHILAGIDNNSIALNTFARNHPKAAALEADIMQLDPQDVMQRLTLRPGDLDCLIGGPPCQGFSKNVPRRERFLDDPRNLLVRRFLEYVRVMRPKVVIMENVAEIVQGYGGAYTEEILGFFDKHNYQTGVKVLYAPDYGIPQRRRRAFFFAYATTKAFSFPSPTHARNDTSSPLFPQPRYPTVGDALSDLPRLRHGEGKSPCQYDQDAKTEYQRKLRSESVLLYDHVARKLRDQQLARLASLGPGQGAKDLSPKLRPKSHYSGAYGKLDMNGIAPTITRWVFHPGSGRFGHPEDDRVITIREAARLQSFPDRFVFEGTYIEKSHQVGNAVPPLLINAFAPVISRLL